MTVYWLTFRLADKHTVKGSYDDRYDRLLDVIGRYSTLDWSETSSFVCFRSDESITTIGQTLKQAIDPSVDLFLIRKLSSPAAVICGAYKETDIFRLMSTDGETYLKKI